MKLARCRELEQNGLGTRRGQKICRGLSSRDVSKLAQKCNWALSISIQVIIVKKCLCEIIKSNMGQHEAFTKACIGM